MLEFNSSILPRELQCDNLSLIKDTEWVFNEQRGWYKDVNADNDAFNHVQTKLPLPINRLRKLHSVSANFTSYFNTPNECLGVNYLMINYSDGTWDYLGIMDSHSNPAYGQTIHQGDAGTLVGSVVDYVNVVLTKTIDSNKTVVSIGAVSNGYTSLYPFSVRGFKDLKLRFK